MSRSTRSNGGSVWTIEFERDADRALQKLDPTVQRRIALYLRERVLTKEGPRQVGDPLQGTKAGYWRYRIGAYRIICRLEDQHLVVAVVKIGHRRDVYR